jgi:F-type H+-transporting ATPase subunit delta
MIIQEVARKYAQALFDSAKSKSIIDNAEEQLAGLLEIMKSDRTLMDFLTSPQATDESKEELVRSVFSERMERLVVEFLIVLLEKNRINFLGEIIDDFVRLAEAEKGIGRITVYTAVTLLDDERLKLKESLLVKSGLKVVLEEKIDKSIYGGMIVVMHNEIIDGSIRHGLEQVEDKLRKVRVL